MVVDRRKQLGLKTTGRDVARPCDQFSLFGFDSTLLKSIEKAGYDKPTAIQQQAIPVILSGRDIVGIAKTGAFIFLGIVNDDWFAISSDVFCSQPESFSS